jgi:hypothetical protein
MRHDLLILSGASLVLGLVTWALWGNPYSSVPRMHTGQSIAADPNSEARVGAQPLHAE